MRKLAIVLASIAAFSIAVSASAQQERPSAPLAAPTDAFEATLSAGYTQPFSLVRNRSPLVDDVAGPAAAFEVGVGARVLAQLGLSANVQVSNGQSDVASSTASRGVAAGVDGAWHFAPDGPRLDPWLQAGFGYHLLWDVTAKDQPNVLDHGFRFLRVIAGVDLRSTSTFAFAPVVGADLSMLLWERVDGTTTNISSPRLATFVFAGAQVRFDVGGAAPPFALARK